MSEEILLFDILLSAERSTEERLTALSGLRPFLEAADGITKLCGAVQAEATVAVKRAMLQQLCELDSARVTDHPVYIETMARIACLDPERPLRLMAVSALAGLAAHVSEVQEVLAETLAYDLDTDIQLASIGGLQNSVSKTAATIEKIGAYLPQAPAACRGALLALVQQLPLPAAAEMALHFTGPLEATPLRLSALHFLAAMPQVPAGILSQLAAMIPVETSLPVRTAIISLLAGMRQVDTALFKNIFEALQQLPDLPDLLVLVTDRLTAHPELQAPFVALFATTPSAGLKIRLLQLLQQAALPQLIVSGLEDANPYVREATLPLLTLRFAAWQEQLEPALAAAIRKEPLVALRSAMVQVLLQTGRKAAETDRLLVELAVAETDHRLKIQLATAACEVFIQDNFQSALLQLYCDILEGQWYPATLKQQVMERLQTFSYSDDPHLRKSLGLLLDQAKDIQEVDRIYRVLKTLEADFSQLAPSLLQALYRHIAWYPQQPLDEWVQLIGKLAEQHPAIRAELPYLVSVTGATWLLKGAEKTDQTGAFLPTLKDAMMKNNGMQSFMEVQRLINDAWNNRTIKKAEIIALYEMLLQTPKSSGLLQQVTGILQQGKLVTPELVTLSLQYILTSPDTEGIYVVRKYLEQVGFIDLEYRERLLRLFTPEQYTLFMQYRLPQVHSKRRIQTFNDWEYAGGWTCPYPQWPVAELVFAIAPGDLVTQLFSELPAGENNNATLHYLVLEHLFRNGNSVWAKQLYGDNQQLEQFLTLLFKGYQQLTARNPLGDRMMYTFWKKWNDYVNRLNSQPMPPALADAATLVYAGVCQLAHRLDPIVKNKQYPQVLKGMNKDLLHQHWPWSEELWEAFSYKNFPVYDPDQEAAAALFQQAARTLQAGQLAEGYQLLKDLMAQYPHTRQVKEQLPVINNTLQQLEEKLRTA
ncbi:hypothetical protein HF324_12360 [Chitinophaga oryzae]|uniref:HEAT repeat domain-containing protein n=1 Tax=Chitinophaga oryzae TaxID=2725414 RepID=A0ABX6LES3_9BACT|nr:formate dehydrogenase accessory protein FdhE [Chitinophaga oryzae]QJB38614.1 hypothetical protein HF324_12360 [Chitinophaga oryzae]